MRPVDIIGIGMTKFGKHPDKTAIELGVLAAIDAMRDAGMPPAQIEIGFYASGAGALLFREITAGQNVFWQAGMHGIPIVNVENACASGASAFHLAWLAVGSGQYDTAVVVGAEKLMVPGLGLLAGGESQLDILEGMVAPAGFALRAVRHMKEFGTTPEQLAMVAVKSRRHGRLNPLAQFRDPITVADVLGAPMIADPLTRLSCCPNADGAAAVVLCAAERTPEFTARPVHVAASVLVSGVDEKPTNLVPWEADYRACRKAYEQAGVGPEDLSAAECHDAFTIAEILHYEAMGLCPTGEGGALVESGATGLGGRIPVNPSGGMLSRGHPIAATSVAQLYEGVLQLRRQAGNRQIENARVFLAECMGGEQFGVAKSCTVQILTA